jgi:hypothetical protein
VWPDADPDGDLADRLDALDRDPPTAERTDLQRTLRDVHLLRGLAVLRNWPAAQDPAGVRAMIASAMAKFACARALDPTFADVHLVVGLLFFQLGDATQRERGIALLRRARMRGVHDPEVIQILNRHHPRTRDGSTDTAALLDIIDSYLRDPTVLDSIRQDLLRMRARFGTARDWDNRPDPAPEGPARPTVSELIDRAELLAARVRMSGLSTSAAGSAVEELAQANEILVAQARSVERLEAAVLGLLGTTMLSEPGR